MANEKRKTADEVEETAEHLEHAHVEPVAEGEHVEHADVAVAVEEQHAAERHEEALTDVPVTGMTRPTHPLESDEHPDGPVEAGDPEIEERQERIRQLEDELRNAELEERRRLIDAEREYTLENLDNREAELKAQLARVRGEQPTEE